jgi:hypothetical protein
MNTNQDTEALDKEVRRHLYDRFMSEGSAATVEETAGALRSTPEEVGAAYRRLAHGHVFVLQGDGEILMANPFSAVPTPFRVEVAGRAWYGNCIWDALGIPAMVRQDARIVTGCGDCNDAMVLTVKDGFLLYPPPGVIHFSVPAQHWWDNIKFT